MTGQQQQPVGVSRDKASDARHAAALKVVEQLEMAGCSFVPSVEHGWTLTGPKGMWNRHDKELTEYAAEITRVLWARAEHVNSLRIAPSNETKH